MLQSLACLHLRIDSQLAHQRSDLMRSLNDSRPFVPERAQKHTRRSDSLLLQALSPRLLGELSVLESGVRRRDSSGYLRRLSLVGWIRLFPGRLPLNYRSIPALVETGESVGEMGRRALTEQLRQPPLLSLSKLVVDVLVYADRDRPD
jgi:hypothetical protein